MIKNKNLFNIFALILLSITVFFLSSCGGSPVIEEYPHDEGLVQQYLDRLDLSLKKEQAGFSYSFTKKYQVNIADETNTDQYFLDYDGMGVFNINQKVKQIANIDYLSFINKHGYLDLHQSESYQYYLQTMRDTEPLIETKNYNCIYDLHVLSSDDIYVASTKTTNDYLHDNVSRKTFNGKIDQDLIAYYQADKINKTFNDQFAMDSWQEIDELNNYFKAFFKANDLKNEKDIINFINDYQVSFIENEQTVVFSLSLDGISALNGLYYASWMGDVKIKINLEMEKATGYVLAIQYDLTDYLTYLLKVSLKENAEVNVQSYIVELKVLDELTNQTEGITYTSYNEENKTLFVSAISEYLEDE